MKKWSVRVRATIVKDIRVEAETQDEAEEIAQGMLASVFDSDDEVFGREVEGSELVEDEPCA